MNSRIKIRVFYWLLPLLVVGILLMLFAPWAGMTITPSGRLSVQTSVALAASAESPTSEQSLGISVADLLATETIEYPPEAKTDFDKLVCIYNLIEQARLIHNEQGAIARSNWEKYEAQWVTFVEVFTPKFEFLLAEQNRLRDNIRHSTYTDEEWKKLAPEEMDAAYLEMFGDKMALKATSTTASSSVLPKLDSINIRSLKQGELIDPTEDLTTYDIVPDPLVYTTITTDRAAFASLPGTVEERVHDDKGSGHFSGDFTHLVDAKCTGVGTTMSAAQTNIWMLANALNGERELIDANEDYIEVHVYAFWTTTKSVRLWERYNGSVQTDSYAFTVNTAYYLKIERSGTTLTCKIYSDAARTDLLDTLSLTLGLAVSYRYIYAINNYNYAPYAQTISGYMENLDLQEAACSPDINNTPASKDFGTVATSSNYTTGLTYFNVTNNSGGAIDISIQGTNMTGGTQWTLSDTATPGADIYGLKAGTDGDGDYSTIVKLNSPYNNLVAGLPDGDSELWGLNLYTPTSFPDGTAKSGTVTVTAVCP